MLLNYRSYILDKKERIKLFRSMNSDQRKKLILEKMKAKNITVGSGVPNKTYNEQSKEVEDLIRIANCFPEMRNKNKNVN
tara:strand:- start:182 stop:421 length:240 start_codon:yes stop_codon:yes gene_type:complete